MISRYFCAILGEDHKFANSLSIAGIRRLKAYALALHVPVLVWLFSASLIANKIFGVEWYYSALVGVAASMFIYLLERLVLAVSGNWVVGVARIAIGVLIALIGAAQFDLIIFEKEIISHQDESKKEAARLLHEKKVAELKAIVDKKHQEWSAAQHIATCEADGSCGSGQRSLGPIYREKVKLAEMLRHEYMLANSKIEEESQRYIKESSDLVVSGSSSSESGILSRLESLHQYLENNSYANAAWWILFLFMLFLELTVVIVKLSFNQDTVDDKLLKLKDEIKLTQAKNFHETLTSSDYQIEKLIASSV